MTEWYHTHEEYSAAELEHIRLDSVEARIDDVLDKIKKVETNAIVCYRETKKMELVLVSLRNSDLSGVQEVHKKIEQTKEALDYSLMVINQLEDLGLKLFHEMKEKEGNDGDNIEDD